MEKALCILSTPYHVINLINILKSEQYTAKDIYIYLLGDAVKEQKDILADLPNVIQMIEIAPIAERKERNKMKRWTNLIASSLKAKKWAKEEQYFRQFHFDELLIPYPTITTLALCGYFQSQNKKTKIVLYEDGFGTYNSFGNYRHGVSKIFFDYTFGFDFYKSVKEVLVYQPDIFKVNSKYNPKVTKIQNYGRTEYLTYYKNRFLKEIDFYSSKRIILFDEYLISNFQNKIDTEIKVAEEIIKRFGEDKFAFKPHPRATKNLEELKNVLSKDKLPFEIIMQCMSNIDDCILISTTSTACITPKIIGGFEPIVITLETVLEGHAELNATFSKVKELYERQNRVVLAKSLDEVLQIIEQALNGEI